MASEVRELYHFLISASAIDPDKAAFAQEISAYAVSGSNISNPVPTNKTYVVEYYWHVVGGQKEDRPTVQTQSFFIIEGGPVTPGQGKAEIHQISAYQIEGLSKDRPNILATKLFQITT